MQKRLFRSENNRILGGVLGGIGEYFDIDPTVVRLVFITVLIITAFFPCAIGYFLAYLVIPERRE